MVAPRWRQFDVFTNPDRETAGSHPYIIVLQSNAISDLDTCVVAPLAPPRAIKLFERLLPEISVKGRRFVIAIPNLAAIPASEVGEPVANLEAERYRIVAALDLVFTGI